MMKVNILPAEKRDAARVKRQTSAALQRSIGLPVVHKWRTFARSLFAGQVVGNLLFEAWNADGEPLERMTAGELAKTSLSRYLIVPHSRSR